MKNAAVLIVLLFTQMAFSQAGQVTGEQLSNNAVNAMRALMAVPTEASEFNEKTDLKSVSLVKNSNEEVVYILRGKLRGIRNGGYRELQILEKITMVPAFTVTYKATLIR